MTLSMFMFLFKTVIAIVGIVFMTRGLMASDYMMAIFGVLLWISIDVGEINHKLNKD